MSSPSLVEDMSLSPPSSLWAPSGHNPGRATNLRKHGQRSRSTVASLARHGDFTGVRPFRRGLNGLRRRRSTRAAGRNQTDGEP